MRNHGQEIEESARGMAYLFIVISVIVLIGILITAGPMIIQGATMP